MDIAGTNPMTATAARHGSRLAVWRAYLASPVDGASLAAFRVVFGLLLAWEVVRYFDHGWIDRYFIQPRFFFAYWPIDFLAPWPGRGMYVHFVVLGVLALCLALGLFYRAAAILFWPAFTYIFLLDKTNYLNHFYFIGLLAFLLILLPAHQVASLDRRLFFHRAPETVPFWSVWVLRAQLFIVYFYAGVAKLNPDWLRGEPMRMWLAERAGFPFVGHLFTHEWVVYFFAYGGLLFDLSVGFLLLSRRTRLFGLALAGLFHFLNSQLFRIGIFPPLAFGATLIFLEPSWPRRVVHWLRRLLGLFVWRWAAPLPPAAPPSSAPAAAVGVPLAFIHVFFLAQLLIPLRHWLYPGEVSWTEEGHRFSWHMLLRDKSARLRVFVTDPLTGQTQEIDPRLDLTDRQWREMRTRPDMVHQYARYLADQLSAGGRPRPRVYVDLQASLNGRPYQPLIDPTVDLAAMPLTLGPAPWILALETPLKPQITQAP